MSETPEAPETPEIERRRRRNIHERNEWAALKFGLDPIRRGGLIGKGRGGGGGAAAAAAGRAGGGGELVGAGKAVVGAGVDGGAAEVGEEAPPVSFDDLVRRWPGRAAQIDDLVGLIGEATDGVPVPPVLVTGPPCCGKTAVVRAVLDHQGCPYVYVNCAEVTSKTVLLEAVMEQMAGTREEIWEANRVDKRYRNADEETAFVEVVADGIPEGEPDEEAKEPGEEETEQLVQRKKGRSRLRTSSWNVFFRQLAALLARRSVAAHRSHLKAVANAKRALAVRSAAARSCASLVHQHAGDGGDAGRARGGGGGLGADAGDDAVGDDAVGDDAGSGEAAGSAGDAADDACDVAGEADAAADDAGDATTTTTTTTTPTPTPLEAFPRKLFVVLDNADMLLGEGAAGVGVGVGEDGWRGPDLLVHVARLPSMVASFTGFAGDAAAAVGKTSEATAMPVPLVCPVLISHNAFFASEIMGAGSGVLGSGRSLVARACPVQLWFPSYTQKELPDVLTATAESFGSDLDLDLKKSGSSSSSSSSGSREISENKTPSSNTPLGTPGRRASCGPASSSSEGRRAFHKMARMMLQGLRNESSDVWELGAEAARMWPFYRKMVEDACEERELLAGLKPLLAETTRRLHDCTKGTNTGVEPVRSPRVGVGGAARAPPSSASSAAAAAPASSAELAWRSRAPWSANANCNSNSNGKARAEKEMRDKKMRHLCLSTAGKHVLVSAYLASHNSRDTDRDLFTSKGSRRSKRLRRTGAQVGNAANLEEAGVVDLPEGKDFQLERLLSIMSSLVAVTTTNTEAANRMGSSELFMQVRSLVRLNLMRESSARRKSFELDSPSYRCNISKELAESVAEDIGITLSQYLVSAR